MTERPILFSAPMIRALLSGTKTQTRRVVKIGSHGDQGSITGCRYGVPGDVLWVRETTRSYYLPNFLTGEPTNALCGQYVADDEPVLDPHEFDLAWWYSRPTCPAIHMPRWASRISLRITDVRVERLQAISEADAKAEGASVCANGFWFDSNPVFAGSDARGAYYTLWEHINGPGSWDANPLVWAVSFERIR